jgi:large subunit ribosomal protein L31
MKEKIHPEYKEATISCACGNVVKTRSTKPNIHVDICSACHPFFTGKQKLVDSAGMVERFTQRLSKKKPPKKKKEAPREEPKVLPEAEAREETKDAQGAGGEEKAV